MQASHDYQESDEKAQHISAKKGVTAVAFGLKGKELVQSQKVGQDTSAKDQGTN